ncbi:Deacetylases, including yeast histone deacetylase and acetoin utilization protein [Caballeronia glathei]|uniref:Deacetylase n=1 Tax=Caballeronia glathei TaxID=60547 RepID=A0A069PRQ4_9BURK|nr:histone deacetylase [Caballeronia glathei]KDR43423.1 deacetylase [Caballeronia glathei]CDY78664.1 Deacetylases, including yeast histone deacetylase and acetoin utilization protein [Caballeronia glathei]
MKAFYSDRFVLPLPAGHRFPMQKYRMLRERVAAQLRDVALHEAPVAGDAELTRAHSASYVARVASGALDANEQREIGFPWSENMVERSRRSVGATIAACRAAIADGFAVNLAGGTHHAYASHGAGFCVFNDAAVAARAMQAEGVVFAAGGEKAQIAIVDLDVHQGNGTASIFRDDPSVFTLSLHGASNYPFTKETSDLDVALPDGCDDDAYAEALSRALETMFERAGPALLIYLAGADPHAGDRLGRLGLTFAGLARRDRLVFEAAAARDLPVAIAMAGGYGRNIDDTVEVHLQTIQLAASACGKRSRTLAGIISRAL